ncbi:hypothetical protein Tco_0555653 [Tanacetum coccineum]
MDVLGLSRDIEWHYMRNTGAGQWNVFIMRYIFADKWEIARVGWYGVVWRIQRESESGALRSYRSSDIHSNSEDRSFTEYVALIIDAVSRFIVYADSLREFSTYLVFMVALVASHKIGSAHRQVGELVD